MALQKYNNGTDATNGKNNIVFFYDRAGVESANRVNVYTQFADKRSMPQKCGKTYKTSRWEHIYDRALESAEFKKYGFISSRNLKEVSDNIKSSLLAEGATTGNELTINKITVETSIATYGSMIAYTDDVVLFSEDAVQVKYREELGEHANAQYEDLLQIDMLNTPTRIYSGVATSTDTMGVGVAVDGSLDKKYTINYELISKCVERLIRNRAEQVTEIVTGSVKVDTKTVGKSYYAIIGIDVYNDLKNITRKTSSEEKFCFVPVQQYAGATTLAEGEVGYVDNVRFILSDTALCYRGEGSKVPDGYAGTLKYTGEIGKDAKFDVFPILFPSKEAIATIGLKGVDKIKFNAVSPEQVALGNPFGKKGFFSYTMKYGSVILKPERILRCEVLAGA